MIEDNTTSSSLYVRRGAGVTGYRFKSPLSGTRLVKSDNVSIGIEFSTYNVSSEKALPDILDKESTINKGGKDSGLMEYHLTNFDSGLMEYHLTNFDISTHAWVHTR